MLNLPLIEAVPNFSEGKNPQVINRIKEALEIPGVRVLNVHTDADHNRSVFTIVGTPRQVEEALIDAVGVAVELIDVSGHRGIHPRIGAADVVPLIPLKNIGVEEVVKIAKRIGRRVNRRYGLPVYFYGLAGERELPSFRNVGLERLKELITTDDYRPDIGDSLHPTAGAIAIGVRDFLVAYNFILDTDDLEVGREIARRLRGSTGFLKRVRVLAFLLESRGRVQISINITDTRRVSLYEIKRAVEAEAGRFGVRVVDGELVGLMPGPFADETLAGFLSMGRAGGPMTIEGALWENFSELESILGALGSKLPRAGGGMAGGISLAMGVALVRKVAVLSKTDVSIEELDGYLYEALDLANRDMACFEELMNAYRKGDEELLRDRIEVCVKESFDMATLPLKVMPAVEKLIAEGNKNLISDVGIALELLRGGFNAARYNILINLKGVDDAEYRSRVLREFRQLEEKMIFYYESYTSRIAMEL